MKICQYLDHSLLTSRRPSPGRPAKETVHIKKLNRRRKFMTAFKTKIHDLRRVFEIMRKTCRHQNFKFLLNHSELQKEVLPQIEKSRV